MKPLIHNNHNVYILGAGFSYDAGLPLISDFLLRMRDSHEWLQKQRRIPEADAVAAVLKFRNEAASAAYWVNLDLEDIEQLFSLASASAGGISDQIRVAIAATLDYARKTNDQRKYQLVVTQSKYVFNVESHKHPSWVKVINREGTVEGQYEVGKYALYTAYLLGMLKNEDALPQGENTFITLNYDTILEDSLAELGRSITYGSTLGSHPCNPSKENYPSVPLFKLHGSVNWARTAENGDTVRVFKNYDDVATANLIPELIPPTWKKVFEDQLEAIWEEAIEKLKTATRIIVIGFSLPPTDMHFKYLLAAGLQTNVSLREIVFVNPDPKNNLQD